MERQGLRVEIKGVRKKPRTSVRNSEQNHVPCQTGRLMVLRNTRASPRVEMTSEFDSFTADEKRLIETLRANGELLETDDENATLPPGVTHILLCKSGQKPKLIQILTAQN